MGENIIGKRFGKLTVKEYGKKVGKKQYCICKCDCGKECEVRSDNLKMGKTKSCGCINAEKTNNILGKRFGRLTVIGVGRTYIMPNGKKGGKYVLCKCDCGKTVEVNRANLMNGSTKSCGCLNKEVQNSVKPERFGVIEQTNVNIILNKNLTKSNTSGIKGVSWHKRKKKWVARIMFKGASYWLGAYSDREDAEIARKAAEEKIYGDFLKWYAEEYPERWEKIQNRESKKCKEK